MPIGNAVQRGSNIYIYDEKGRHIGNVSAGAGKDDGLVGYTSTTVNVRRGTAICMYDEKGRMTGSVPAR